MRQVLVLILLGAFFLNGCARLVDPYYSDSMSCEIEGVDDGHCVSLDESYRMAMSDMYGMPRGAVTSREEGKKEWKKYVAAGLLGGAAGAGLGYALTPKDVDVKYIPRTEGGYTWYEVVKKTSRNPLVPVLVGAVIGGGAAALFTWLVTNYRQDKISNKQLNRFYRAAQDYSRCIKEASEMEKEIGPDGVAEKVEKCGGYLAFLPGLEVLRSEDVSTAFKIRQKREREVRQVLSSIAGQKRIIPLRTPPKTSRVLITPWVDNSDVLHQGEVIFITLDNGRWIMPDRVDAAQSSSAQFGEGR